MPTALRGHGKTCPRKAVGMAPIVLGRPFNYEVVRFPSPLRSLAAALPPAVGDSPLFISALADLVLRALGLPQGSAVSSLTAASLP